MAQALIKIDGSIGSDTNIVFGAIVQLDNQNAGGELTYAWTLLQKPVGSAASLSSTVIQNPTFTADKEGSYLVQLIVNAGLPSEQRNRVIAAVRDLRTGLRQPAADETIEDGATGWAPTVNGWLTVVSKFRSDPGVCEAVCDYIGAARGDVVFLSGVYTLPNGSVLPRFQRADSTLLTFVLGKLAVLETSVITDDPFPVPGDVCYVRTSGLFRNATLTTGYGLGTHPPVYVTDAGRIDGVVTGSRYPRRIGTVVATYGPIDVDLDIDALSIPTPSTLTWGCDIGPAGAFLGWLYPGYGAASFSASAIAYAAQAGTYYDLRVKAGVAPTGAVGTYQSIVLSVGGIVGGPFVNLVPGATYAELTSGALSASIPASSTALIALEIGSAGLTTAAQRIVASMSFLPA